MDHPAASDVSSSYEGFKSPSSRSISDPVGLDQRHITSRNTETDSLSITNTLQYGSNARYPPSKSYQNVNVLNTNISTNPSNSKVYPEIPTFLDGSDSDVYFEPEQMDSYYPTGTDFNQLLSEWNPSDNSGHDSGSVLDIYPKNHGPWQGLMTPWPGASVEYPTRKACATLYLHLE
jgi:hypothetical protein